MTNGDEVLYKYFKNKLLLVFTLFFLGTAYAGINDYIFPNSDYPSISNYGTTGLIQIPTARFFSEGSLALGFSSTDPYNRLSIIAYPFSWLEASYQYTDIENALYSDVYLFSGNQTYKDKSFDFKFRVLKESNVFPQVALGFRDLAGTGIFASEYLVASKKINNLDITFGIGWGSMSNDRFSNPLKKIDGRFETRTKNDDTKGGDVNFDYLFSGDIDFFGGIEYAIPNFFGTRLRVEYDSTNYKREGFPFGRDSFRYAFKPVRQPDSSFNFGVLYPVNNNFHLKLGFAKGNTVSLGFSLHRDFGRKNSRLKEKNRFEPIKNAKTIQKITARNDDLLYKASLKYLADYSFYLQRATIDGDELSIVYSQSAHQSWMRSTGRVLRVLNDISPQKIKNFNISNINAGMGMHTVSIDRDSFRRSLQNEHYSVAAKSIRFNEFEYEPDMYKFKPEVNYPAHFWRLGPIVKSQIGGPDGFYFGNIKLQYASETLLNKKTNITTMISYGLVDNFDRLKLASDSVLPHVRTDIVQYLKNSKEFSIDQIQLNYFSKPTKNIYTKISAGIFEMMFMGFGGEVLYRPFSSNYGIGAELWQVQQREFDMIFGTRDYSTLTGHINLYYKEPRSQVIFRIKGGKFLAKDSGINFDFSRRFKRGLRIGAYFARTDISKFEFGEGSFDKGFYFYVPLESLFESYSKRNTGYGLRPITRDGAAYLNHSLHLWGVSEQGQKLNLNRDIDDFYD